MAAAREEVVFNSVTTGASNDIERATQIARAMVTQYGMSDTFGLMGLESVQSRYLDGRPVMNCSDATGALIDKEVQKILKEAYDKALAIIRNTGMPWTRLRPSCWRRRPSPQRVHEYL